MSHATRVQTAPLAEREHPVPAALSDSPPSPARRALLLGASGAALAATAPRLANAAASIATYNDNDLLNFALNLEYLEANFYYLAAFGTTIDLPNAASTAAGAPVIAMSGTGTQGSVVAKANARVPFSFVTVGAYATETALEEGRHVALLRTTLGAAAVAQPALDLESSFNALASAAGIASPFDPFASDLNFLLGAFVFEDVGVTAYRGLAPLLSTTLTGRTNLQTASGLLAVEAYHAGLIRTSLLTLDPAGTLGYLPATQKIAALRAQLSLAANNQAANPDDLGISTTATVTLQNGTSAPATQLVDANPLTAQVFSRNTNQVLNIVTGGGATAAGSAAKGLFFPAGLNGRFV